MNNEQGISNNEVKEKDENNGTTILGNWVFLTSTFIIPCSILDIMFRHEN